MNNTTTVDAGMLIVNGRTYVPADAVKPMGKMHMIRTRSAGVHYGEIVSRTNHGDTDEVVLANARRVYYWDGAATLSQLAGTGPSKPQNCKFPAPVAEITLLGAVEIIPITAEAQKALDAVKHWVE